MARDDASRGFTMGCWFVIGVMFALFVLPLMGWLMCCGGLATLGLVGSAVKDDRPSAPVIAESSARIDPTASASERNAELSRRLAEDAEVKSAKTDIAQLERIGADRSQVSKAKAALARLERAIENRRTEWRRVYGPLPGEQLSAAPTSPSSPSDSLPPPVRVIERGFFEVAMREVADRAREASELADKKAAAEFAEKEAAARAAAERAAKLERDEDDAKTLLDFAKRDPNPTTKTKSLRSLIEKFPKTKAADEARKLLKP